MVQAERDTVAIHRIELPTPFPVGPVNAYVLVHGDQRVLVDCGPRSDEAMTAMEAGLATLGLQPGDITSILLTHGHIDHVGMTASFRAHGALVHAHPDVAGWLNPGGPADAYRQDFFVSLYREMGMDLEASEQALHEFSLFRQWNDQSVVDVTLADGEVFAPLPMFRVVYVPGHAQAAIGLWNPETGDFLSGDQLLPHISSNALIEPQPGAASGGRAQRTKSLLDYRGNLQYLRTLPIQQVYPGHGAAFTDVTQVIDRRLDDQWARRTQVAELLRKHRSASAYAIAQAFFPRHRRQSSLILSEILGYLDWLLEDGEVRCEANAEGVVQWRPRADS